MRFRLIQIFEWTTAIAVVLAITMAFVNHIYPHVSNLKGSPLLNWGRFFAVWTPIVGGAFLFLYWGIYGKPNDSWITFGLIAGVVVGVIAGNVTSLGEWTIDHFNPNLPYRDFRTTFGTIVGAIGGAWFGALGGGIASKFFRKRSPK